MRCHVYLFGRCTPTLIYTYACTCLCRLTCDIDDKPTIEPRWPTKVRLEPRTHQNGHRIEENVDINIRPNWICKSVGFLLSGVASLNEAAGIEIMYGWLPFLAVCPFFADSPLLFLPSFLSPFCFPPIHFLCAAWTLSLPTQPVSRIFDIHPSSSIPFYPVLGCPLGAHTLLAAWNQVLSAERLAAEDIRRRKRRLEIRGDSMVHDG